MATESAALDQGRAAWRWLDGHLDRFTPWRGDGELSMEGLQALAELAIVLVRLTGRSRAWDTLASQHDAEARWRDHILAQLSMSAVAQLPRKRPMQAFPYLLPYLVMRSTGWRDAYYERTLDLLIAAGFPDIAEVVPFRRLDVAYFLAKAGCNVGEGVESLYRRTALANLRSLVFADDETAYSITHTLLYLSDFGADAIALPDLEVSRLRPIVESLLVHYWRLRHWDLLGELLLCSEIVGHPDRTLAGYATEAFRNAHWRNGAIPGREDAEADLAHADEAGDRARLFSGLYHTTVVSLLHAARVIECHDG